MSLPKSNIYKITINGSKGAAFAEYRNGILTLFINEWSNDTEPPQYIPMFETLLMQDQAIITVTLLVPKTVAEKVAMFCIIYKEIKGFMYRASKEEKANLKLVTVSRPLLETYFKNTSFPLSANKTMADYVKHYNTVRDITVNGQQKTSKEFPAVYDREFEKRISDDVSKLQRYWAHLRALGWRKVDDIWTQIN